MRKKKSKMVTLTNIMGSLELVRFRYTGDYKMCVIIKGSGNDWKMSYIALLEYEAKHLAAKWGLTIIVKEVPLRE